jgi:putative aldouronate transport system permease protein
MYVYKVGLQNMNYNIATAVGLFQSVVGVVLVFIADRIAKLMGESGIV